MIRAKIITKELMNLFYMRDGHLYWKRNKLAGNLTKMGYYVVTVDKKIYKVHRILYQFYHNIILDPTDIIDHIDCNKANNKKENLRLSSVSQNGMNRKSSNGNLSTGIKNISLVTITYKNYDYNYYRITIQENGKSHKWRFNTKDFSLQDVIKIRDEKLDILHKEFKNKGEK